MKRLETLLAVSAALVAASACDLGDKSIGDETGNDDAAADDGGSDDGAADDGAADDGATSGSSLDAGDGACTLIGCDDMLTVTLAYTTLAEGTWTVAIDAPDEGGSELCSFTSDGAGAIDQGGCDGFFTPGEIIIVASQMWNHVDVTVSLDGVPRASTSADVGYHDVAPNGPDCGPVCTQGDVDLEISDAPVVTCEDIEGAYDSAFSAAQACADASECGQTLTWGSCGCTRAPVVRLDADIDPLDGLWTQGTEKECAFTQVGSTCDCPEADGFACIDGACTWNYL